jgi:hypothetical protein
MLTVVDLLLAPTTVLIPLVVILPIHNLVTVIVVHIQGHGAPRSQNHKMLFVIKKCYLLVINNS